jgi:hypothetical protein
MSEKKEKKKDSNELLNFIMIILGLLFLFKGVMDFLAWAGIIYPSWLDVSSTPELAAALTLFGSQGLISIALGFWCLVAGIGMFREEEYAMGIGLVVLSIMALTGLISVIGWVSNPASFDLAYWPNYIVLIAFIVGVLGFVWLLVTYKRYN